MKNGNPPRDHALTITALLAVVMILITSSLSAQTQGQKTFASSKEAVDALIQAVQSGDNSGLQNILGAGSEAIISSGDEVADKTARESFVARYHTRHSLVASGQHHFTLNVGSDNWPLPIPLVDNSGKWYFDGQAGKEEIVYRRIGRNELEAIDVCKGVVSAQRDYAGSAHDGKPAGTYAERVVSDPGKRNGLYWEAKSGEPESPAGPMLAEASQEGYDTPGQRTPYHGYYYRMLKNPGGFAFIAHPAQYRTSGVMTFVVTQSGVIYQKDLGDKTDEIVSKLQQYQIDGTWKKVR